MKAIRREVSEREGLADDRERKEKVQARRRVRKLCIDIRVQDVTSIVLLYSLISISLIRLRPSVRMESLFEGKPQIRSPSPTPFFSKKRSNNGIRRGFGGNIPKVIYIVNPIMPKPGLTPFCISWDRIKELHFQAKEDRLPHLLPLDGQDFHQRWYAFSFHFRLRSARLASMRIHSFLSQQERRGVGKTNQIESRKG